MNKMMNTAKTLDKVLHVFEIITKVAFVASIVAALLLSAVLIFDIEPSMVGEMDYTVGIGDFVFELAEGVAPSTDKLMLVELITLALMIPVFFVGIKAVKALRKVLQAMAEGNPFHAGISKQIRKLAFFELVVGILDNVANSIVPMISFDSFALKNILLSDKIAAVTYAPVFDIGFLIVVGITLLLSYVFAYGEQLQNLSDETL
ncbi:MAG: hypothetical protein IKW00_01525 [Clostridia bacterium]|nr:hypothetical protein [Clostridia bacterium]